MHPSLFEHEEPILLMPGVLVSAIAMTAWFSRNLLAYFRPFGVSEVESLMNCSRLGTLQCNCVPTDAAAPHNDRRQSCRACGNAIVSDDPARLYTEMSSREIDQLAETMRRRAIDEARHASPLPSGEYTDTYAQHRVQ
jgi:hypothetical protein